MLKKESVLTVIAGMPDTFTIDELMDRLILIHKIDEGERQSDAGKVFSTKEAKSKLKKWMDEID